VPDGVPVKVLVPPAQYDSLDREAISRGLSVPAVIRERIAGPKNPQTSQTP
jgi:hypothetical protein